MSILYDSKCDCNGPSTLFFHFMVSPSADGLPGKFVLALTLQPVNVITTVLRSHTTLLAELKDHTNFSVQLCVKHPLIVYEAVDVRLFEHYITSYQRQYRYNFLCVLLRRGGLGDFLAL